MKKKMIAVLISLLMLSPVLAVSEDNIRIRYREATFLDRLLRLIQPFAVVSPATPNPGDWVTVSLYLEVPEIGGDYSGGDCPVSLMLYLWFFKGSGRQLEDVVDDYSTYYTGCDMCSSIIDVDYKVPSGWSGDYGVEGVVSCGYLDYSTIDYGTFTVTGVVTTTVPGVTCTYGEMKCIGTERWVCLTDGWNFHSDCLPGVCVEISSTELQCQYEEVTTTTALACLSDGTTASAGVDCGKSWSEGWMECPGCCSGWAYCEYIQAGFWPVQHCECKTKPPEPTRPATCDEVPFDYMNAKVLGTCTKVDDGHYTCVDRSIAICRGLAWGAEVEASYPYCWYEMNVCPTGSVCVVLADGSTQCQKETGEVVSPEPTKEKLCDGCFQGGICYDIGKVVKDFCDTSNRRVYCVGKNTYEVRYDCGIECEKYKDESSCEEANCIWFDPYWYETGLEKVHTGYGSCMNCIPIGTKLAEGHMNCIAFRNAHRGECCPFVEEGYSWSQMGEIYEEYPRMPGEQKLEAQCYCTGKCWEEKDVQNNTFEWCEGYPDYKKELAKQGERKTEGNLINIVVEAMKWPELPGWPKLPPILSKEIFGFPIWLIIIVLFVFVLILKR